MKTLAHRHDLRSRVIDQHPRHVTIGTTLVCPICSRALWEAITRLQRTLTQRNTP